MSAANADLVWLEDAARLDTQLEAWRLELVDVSRRNRLLWFANTNSTLELTRPSAAEIYARLVRGGRWGFFWPEGPHDEGGPEPAPDPRPAANELVTDKADPDLLQRTLRGLERRASQALIDAGILTLHLGFGMLRWRIPGEPQLPNSPLVLMPVLLQRPSRREPFELRRAEGDLVINPALAVRLLEFGVTLPAAEDQDDIDLEDLYAGVRSACRRWPDWRVEDRVVLATFSFQKLAMHRDLDEHRESVLSHPIVQTLARGRDDSQRFSLAPIPQSQLDEVVPPEQLVSILDADSSQRQCIKAATDGRTFVIDGPPGTGKSQTIANIIAELMSQQKSILFVSEKAAALDVVQNRLAAAGLGDYLLALHSHKVTRKEVAQELGRVLHSQPSSPPRMERSRLERLRARRQTLAEYVAAINQVREPLGLSLNQAMGRISLLHGLPRVAWWSGSASELTMEEFNRIIDQAGSLARSWGPVSRSDDFQWRDLVLAEADMQLIHGIEGELQEGLSRLDHLRLTVEQAASQTGLEWSAGTEPALRLHLVLKHLSDRPPSVPEHWIQDSTPLAVRSRVAEVRTSWESRDQAAAELQAVFGPSWAKIDQAASAALNAGEARLAGGVVAWELPAGATAASLEATAELTARLFEQLPTVQSLGTDLRRALGIAERGFTLRTLSALAELGVLSTDADRPEPQWLSAATLPAVIEAATALETLVLDYRARREALKEVYRDAVLQLDLETLCVRYEEVYRGPLKILSAQYHRDDSLLAAATRLGRVDRRAVANLRAALEWQLAASALRDAEARYAPALGDYYQGVATDFARLRRALDRARRAMALAYDELDLAQVPPQVALDSPVDGLFTGSAHRLSTILSGLREEVGALLPDSATAIFETSILELGASTEDARAAIATVSSILRHLSVVAGREVDLAQARLNLPLRARAAKLEHDLSTRFESDRQLLGDLYRAAATDWSELESAVAWAEGLLILVGRPDEGGAARLMSCRVDPVPLGDALAGWYQSRARVLSFFQPARAEGLERSLVGPFDEAAAELRRLLATTPDIDEWLRHRKHLASLAEVGLGETVVDCVTQAVSAEQLAGLIERALLEGWVDQVTRAVPAVRGLSGDDRDTLVSDFRSLDRELIARSASTIMQSCNSRRRGASPIEAGLVQSQANLKRRHMPIRRLLRETSDLAKRLKPCFMMSPLSVSSFLPPDIAFDVVIFDEASQVRPSDAINCIYRGAQLIVAGDQKQLTPTDFFEAHALDDDEPAEDEAPPVYESILDQCKASQIPSLSLLWHYRSQHESLIGFSNHSYYDGNLITFPGAVASADDLGVRLIRVGGRYLEDGTNPIEAAEVANRVLHFAQLSASRPRALSVGVVTFSDAQEECVLRAVEDAFALRPDLAGFLEGDRLSGFFVKNLESVQGDERDVIIFSVGYGPGRDGQFRLQLGPLTHAGGERRLNVAVTRARRCVEVVSSIGPEAFSRELKPGGGLWHLKRYLAYAESGGELAAAGHNAMGSPDGPLEASIASTLEAWGYQVDAQVGMSHYRVDLAVRHPQDRSRYMLGIECDGAMYHSSSVARDRDRLRQKTLGSLGWTLHRIWSPAWYRERPAEERRLRAALEAALGQFPVEPDQPAATAERPVVSAHGPEVAQEPVAEAPGFPLRLEAPAVPLLLLAPAGQPSTAQPSGARRIRPGAAGTIDVPRLGTTAMDARRVDVGCVVRIRCGEAEESWQIVPPGDADPGRGKLSAATRIGAGLLGCGLGDIVVVESPTGTHEFEVTAITLP